MSAINMPQSVWLIAGPTASGKSALALRLAEAIGGEIVNADSMQLYRGLPILSAAPSPEDRARAPHHLYGVADPQETWSAGVWLRAARPALEIILGRGRPAVVVGGTGLYLRALTQGLAPVPEVPPVVRAQALLLWERAGEEGVREALRLEDPVSEAKIGRADRQRLLRALEVVRATGRPLHDFQRSAAGAIAAPWRGVVLEPPREVLYAQCDRRLEAMVSKGALQEVEALLDLRLDPAAPVMKALGVRELASVLSGARSLAEGLDEARRSTRRYAKRQLTWFRHQTPDWPKIASPDADRAWEALRREVGIGGP